MQIYWFTILALWFFIAAHVSFSIGRLLFNTSMPDQNTQHITDESLCDCVMRFLGRAVLHFDTLKFVPKVPIDNHRSSINLASSENRAMFGSANGLSPVGCQAITRTNDDVSRIRQLETNVIYHWIKYYVRRCLLRNDDHSVPASKLLTIWGRVTHICISTLYLQRLVAWSAPSHCLNHAICWHIVNWATGNKFQWNWVQHIFHSRKLIYIYIYVCVCVCVIWEM